MAFSPYCDNPECNTSLLGQDRRYHTRFGDFCSVYCGDEFGLNCAPPARSLLLAQLQICVHDHPMDSQRFDALHYLGGAAIRAGHNQQKYVFAQREFDRALNSPRLLGRPVDGVAA